MRTKYAILLMAAMLVAGSLFAQDLPSAGTATTVAPSLGPTQNQGPLLLTEVLAALKKKGQTDQLKADIKSRGVDFEVDADTEKQLRKAKATEDVITAIKAVGPKERQATARSAAIAAGLPVVEPDEKDEFKALQSELDPNKSITLAEAYAQKHPASNMLTYVLAYEANAYESKGDAVKTVEFAEKSLKLKPDNFMSLLMVCYAMPQPQYIKHHDADEGKQLEQAEAYCKQAEAGVDALKKGESESDADFADRKAGYRASLHADRGMIHLDLAQMGLMSVDTDEVAKAVKEYNAAVSYSRPAPADYFRLGEANELLGKKDDALAAYTQASQLGQGAIKQYADRKIAALKAAK